MGYTDHLKRILNGIQKKLKNWEEAKHFKQILFNGAPVTAVMMIKIGKSKIPTLITQDTENMMSTSFANRIKKYLDNECIRIGEKTIQYIAIESKHGFLGFTSLKLKENSKNFVVLGQQWKKNINTQINTGVIKKQKMTPQTIYMLANKNAIANGLRTTQNYQYKMLNNLTK